MVKTKTNYECEECGKQLKGKRALAGHRWFAHGKSGGEKGSLQDKIDLLEREKGTNSDTIERIEKIEGLVEKLVKAVSDLTKIMREFGDAVLKFTQKPANPGNPGNPDQVKKKTDEEEDDGLPDIITPFLDMLDNLLGTTDDDDSIFL